MSGAELMAVGTFVILALGAIFGTFWRFWGLIDRAGQEGKEAKTDLAAYKTHVAETFATKQGQREQTETILAAVNGIRDDVKNLNGRIDRMLEAQPKPLRRQS